MAKDETDRLTPKQLALDVATLEALYNIESYAPRDAKLSAANLDKLQGDMRQAQGVETRAIAALKTAKDNAKAAEWNFHNKILKVPTEVKSQFGDDSNELQAIGRKKKSEFKRPKKKPRKT